MEELGLDVDLDSVLWSWQTLVLDEAQETGVDWDADRKKDRE